MLVMGVVDIPYVDQSPPKKAAKARKGKAAKPKKPAKGKKGVQQTTGEVAEILEDKYHVMEHYVHDSMPYIQRCLIESLEGSIVNLSIGLGVPATPFEGANDLIAQNFRDFLDRSVIETMGIPGVPTQAAKDGVNHRLKLKKGNRRPSFIDTGLYQTSAKVWTE